MGSRPSRMRPAIRYLSLMQPGVDRGPVNEAGDLKPDPWEERSFVGRARLSDLLDFLLGANMRFARRLGKVLRLIGAGQQVVN